MNWKKGTIFSIAVWGFKGYWIVIKDINKQYALCGRLKGSDPRLFPEGRKMKMLKSLYEYHGKIEKGLLLRHLVMPGSPEESRNIFEFIANEISPATLVNIMGQYYPAGKVNDRRYPEINHRLKSGELAQAIELAKNAGLTRIC